MVIRANWMIMTRHRDQVMQKPEGTMLSKTIKKIYTLGVQGHTGLCAVVRLLGLSSEMILALSVRGPTLVVRI